MSRPSIAFSVKARRARSSAQNPNPNRNLNLTNREDYDYDYDYDWTPYLSSCPILECGDNQRAAPLSGRCTKAASRGRPLWPRHNTESATAGAARTPGPPPLMQGPRHAEESQSAWAPRRLQKQGCSSPRGVILWSFWLKTCNLNRTSRALIWGVWLYDQVPAGNK